MIVTFALHMVIRRCYLLLYHTMLHSPQHLLHGPRQRHTRRQIRIWSSCLIRCENLTPGRAESVLEGVPVSGVYCNLLPILPIVLFFKTDRKYTGTRTVAHRSETEPRTTKKIRTPPNKPPQQTTSTRVQEQQHQSQPRSIISVNDIVQCVRSYHDDSIQLRQ